jgi:SAM-dependent methyltransferase
MGYGNDHFSGAVAKWIDDGWLPIGGRIVEFGSQEFYGDQSEARRSVRQFLRDRGVSAKAIRAAVPEDKPVSIAEVYRVLGIDYLAIDVDEERGSRFFDLNSFAPPIAWRAAFDLINNEGTIEHLINPINGFQVAHELLKVGGVAIHSMPLTGWLEHGMAHPTLKFYCDLAGANHYELLQAQILFEEAPFHIGDERFGLANVNGEPMSADDLKMTQCWVKLAARKTRAIEFRAPFDHIDAERTDELGRQLADNYASYARARLTASRHRDPVGDELERQLEMQARDFRNQRWMQQRDHEHSEKLARDLQQRDHAHADALVDRSAARGQSMPAAITPTVMLVVTLALLNGGALLLTMGRDTVPNVRSVFAIGLLAAAVPAFVAWTNFAGRRTRLGMAIRHGSRFGWIGSAIAFAAGCLIS